MADLDALGPCPVCGASGGRCANDQHPKTADVKTIEWSEDVVDPAAHPEGEIVAAERIWDEIPIWNSPRTRRVLAYRPGQLVPREDADRLHVGPDGRQIEGDKMPDLQGTSQPKLERK